MATVTLHEVSHRYPSTHTVTVDSVSFHIEDGECLVLLGAARSGKTTLLRMIHGLEKPSSGRIFIDGSDVTELSPTDRDAVMAFEAYALYPHMTLAENMGFALRVAGLDDAEITSRVCRAATILGLETQLNKSPDEVSGTVRQTIALARAIVRQPKLLLLDEPLAKVPDATRQFTRNMFVKLQRELSLTALYATEDLPDALIIGTRIAVLDHGRVSGVYTPDQLRADYSLLSPALDAQWNTNPP